MNDAEVLIKFKADTEDVEKKTSGLGSKIKSSLGVAAGAAAAAAGAFATATISNIAKNSVKAFAEYEQNLGGVETLFKDSADKVIKNAERAYKTAGVSANEYMAGVTSFSASLLQSLGGDTEKAAEVADTAFRDMSDNANKFGTDMQAIQNAYQGFAKQNYTMLDNLKLGYGGTKTEMERLLADAEKISGVKYDISNLSDVYSAIHVIQEELGVTGTTAEEAEKTISGSFNMTKASFENLMTAIASGEGLDTALQEFLTSVGTLGENLIPVIETIATTVVQMLPTITEKVIGVLPELIQTLLPALLQGTVGVIQGLIAALPELILMIAEMLPDMLPTIIEAILSIIPMLIDNMPLFLEAGAKLIGGLLEGIWKSVPKLLEGIWNIIVSMVNYYKQLPGMLLEVGKNMITGLWNGIKNVSQWVIDKIKGLGKSILSAVKGIFGIHSPSKEFAVIGEYNMLGLEKGMEDMQPEIQRDIDGMFDLSPSMTGSMSNVLSPNIQVVNNIEMNQDPLGQMVNTMKTFSGGSKNDYNYGMGG